jgi:methionine-gamma-lyase
VRDLQHFGEEGGVVPAIDLAATSTFLDPSDMEKTFLGEKEGCYLYSRHSNPTTTMFAQKMAAFEGTEAALGTASGMAAIASVLEQILVSGDEVISSLTVYGGTYALFKNIFPRQGIKVHFVDTNDLQAVEKLVNRNTRVIYTETLSNPLLRVADIAALSAIAKSHDLKLIVDNTFAVGLVNPVRWGADVVVHSCTKFISGASDMIAGAICGTHDFIRSLIDVNSGVAMLKGPVLDSKLAHELYLRLDHLPLRIAAHSRSAQYLAEKFEQNEVPVIYPGLKSHPHHEKLKSVLNHDFGFGGMMAIETPSAELAMQLAAQLQQNKFGLYAVSLGFSRTLLTVPAVTTSSEISEEDQRTMRLNKGLLRMSIGYTGADTVMFERFMSAYQKVLPRTGL